jgi:hypothetical protein
MGAKKVGDEGASLGHARGVRGNVFAGKRVVLENSGSDVFAG